MNPLTQFHAWFAEATAHPHIKEPTAMTLATADAAGTPSARIVLLKEVDDAGFHFFTNYESRKSAELAARPHAALCFYWMPLDKQVRIEGTVSKASDAESDAYFATRGREKQLGAWASQQSRPMHARDDLEKRIAQMDEKFTGGEVPRPPHWGGWVLQPQRMEFWLQRDFRLHEREVFVRDGTDWQHTLLYP